MEDMGSLLKDTGLEPSSIGNADSSLHLEAEGFERRHVKELD